jgi:hypothetical protein
VLGTKLAQSLRASNSPVRAYDPDVKPPRSSDVWSLRFPESDALHRSPGFGPMDSDGVLGSDIGAPRTPASGRISNS